MSEPLSMPAEWVEYVGDGTPGWRGVWPEPGDAGHVLAGARGGLVLVRWRLRATGEERDVWTSRARVRVMEAGHG